MNDGPTTERTDERVALGRYRASLRVRLGLKQTELAARAGVSPATVYNAEKGEFIGEDTLTRLTSALGVPLAAYVGTTAEVPASPASAT